MKTTLITLVNSQEVFSTLLDAKLPVKTAYKLQKIAKLVGPEIQQYEEFRTKLIKEKYGEQVGENWQVKPEQIADFAKDLSEVLSVEVNVDYDKITLPEDYVVSTRDLSLLEWLLNID